MSYALVGAAEISNRATRDAAAALERSTTDTGAAGYAGTTALEAAAGLGIEAAVVCAALLVEPAAKDRATAHVSFIYAGAIASPVTAQLVAIAARGPARDLAGAAATVGRSPAAGSVT